MRKTDDLADESGTAEEKESALDQWRRALHAAIAGVPSGWTGFPALADTVSRCSIPVALLHDVIDGVSMDVQPRSFATFEELADYCYHVASAVGLCCIRIWGYRSEGGKAERLAEACGIALQLTNILRDVREDAQNGRIYLPAVEMDRFGVTAQDLIARWPTPALRTLIAFEADRAFEYYDQARGLIPLVDPIGRPVLSCIVGIYRALLEEIVRRDYDVMKERVSIPAWRKAVIALRSLPQRFRSTVLPKTPSPVS
jgi:phytoene synthase